MRGIVWILGAVLVGLIVFEVSMQPTASDRLLLTLIFLVVALLAVGLAIALRWRGRRSTSIRRSVMIVGLAGLAIAAVAIVIAAQQMFLSQHDLNLLMVVLVFAVATVVAFSVSVSGDVARDLEATAAAAQKLQDGDLSARTGVDRADEVGTVAAAFDEMAAELEQREEERTADDAARRRFLAAIGHDLRTPLASLRAAVEALEDGIAPDPKRYLESMDQNIEVLSSLVDDLFLLSRLETHSIEIERVPIDVTEIVDEAIEVMTPVAAAVDVRVELDADHRITAIGDASAVGRVVRNLLDNAARFAPSGSSVVVGVGEEGGAVVRVADAGPGFDAAFVDQAFDQFTRGDPSRERSTGGAGLGLAIARGLVDGMGGAIWAEPGPGGRVAVPPPDRSGRAGGLTGSARHT